MIIGDIETTEKVEYEDLLKNYYEKMKIIEEQDKEIERLNNIINELEKKTKLAEERQYELYTENELLKKKLEWYKNIKQ